MSDHSKDEYGAPGLTTPIGRTGRRPPPKIDRVNAPFANFMTGGLASKSSEFIKSLGTSNESTIRFSLSMIRAAGTERLGRGNGKLSEDTWRRSGRASTGVVSFEPLSDDATEITLKLRSVFDPSISGQSAEEYLQNFKQLVENPKR